MTSRHHRHRALSCRQLVTVEQSKSQLRSRATCGFNHWSYWTGMCNHHEPDRSTVLLARRGSRVQAQVEFALLLHVHYAIVKPSASLSALSALAMLSDGGI